MAACSSLHPTVEYPVPPSVADAFYEDIGGEGGSPDCISVTQNGLPFVVSRLYTAKDVIPNTRDEVGVGIVGSVNLSIHTSS